MRFMKFESSLHALSPRIPFCFYLSTQPEFLQQGTVRDDKLCRFPSCYGPSDQARYNFRCLILRENFIIPCWCKQLQGYCRENQRVVLS